MYEGNFGTLQFGMLEKSWNFGLKNGTWEHKGSKISRKSLIKLFSDFLILENNNYYIATPYEKELVVVEDMPFYTGYIEVISLDKKQLIIFKLNTGQRIV